MASKTSPKGKGEKKMTADELAERLTDSEADIEIDETVHTVSNENGKRIRRMVYRVRVVDQLDE